MSCKKLWMAIVAVAMLAAPLWSALFPVGPGEPYPYIMWAIYQASDGDTISVKSGTESDPLVYEEQIDFMGKDILVAAREVGATSPYQIDHPNPLATVIKLPDTLATSDEASVVYFRNGESQNAELRGFTITNGRGTAYTTWFPEFTEDKTLNMVVKTAYLGGGIFISNSNPLIKRCEIRNNILDHEEGGEFQDGGGGGISCDNASPEILYCVIKENTIHASHDNVAAGGGIYISNHSDPLIRDCQIIGNSCNADSPAVADGGGIAITLASSPRIYSNEIRNNYATLMGGGIFIWGTAPYEGSPIIKRNYITYNRTGRRGDWILGGGGIFTQDCNVKIGNNMFGRNRSGSIGGAISIRAGVNNIVVTFINNTIYRNGARDAAGVSIITQSGLTRETKVYFKNNVVVWNDTGGVHMIDSVILYNDYTCYHGNVEYDLLGVEIDPHAILINPHLDGNYHVTPGSPLIDAGDNCAWSSFPSGDVDYNPHADIDGDDRYADGDSVLGIRIDIGADEYPGPTFVCGDENMDGSVDLADVTYLFINLMPAPTICPYFLGDLNGDCSVDITDVLHLLENMFPQPHNLNCPGEEVCEPIPGTLGDGLAEVFLTNAITLDERTFSISINLRNEKPVAGTQFEIGYDPEKWEILGVSSTGRAVDFMTADGYEYGTYSFGQLCPLEKVKKGMSTGEGPIAKLKLKWIGDGQPSLSDIRINNAIVVNTHAHRMLVNIRPGIRSLKMEKETKVPTVFGITEIIPNPFNANTSIKFSVPVETEVELNIYNTAGQRVRTLLQKRLEPGYYTLLWNGKDNNGKELPGGIYFIMLKSRNQRSVKKLTLLK